MWRLVIPYALALVVAAILLESLRFRHASRMLSTEIYVALVALGFIALGLWVGSRLTPRAAGPHFQRNEAAVRSLGLTAREIELLELLASGQSNKELARRLGISPNTVKTHLANLYAKMEVQKRVQAIEKARFLTIIP